MLSGFKFLGVVVLDVQGSETEADSLACCHKGEYTLDQCGYITDTCLEMSLQEQHTSDRHRRCCGESVKRIG